MHNPTMCEVTAEMTGTLREHIKRRLLTCDIRRVCTLQIEMHYLGQHRPD